MLNGYPLNAAPLNTPGGATTPTEPEGPVVILPPETPGPGMPAAGFAYRWGVSLLMGGQQAAARLTGRLEIDREEGAAAVATFTLYYPPGTEVPADLGGAPVFIDFISETGGQSVQARRYTGIAIEPSWDVVNRVMTITCSDNLQWRVEAMEVEAIDALVGGSWSADVFEAVDGRSRWDYAGERLSTQPASLDIGVEGDLRRTSWYAGQPAYEFGPGSTLYQTVNVELAQANSATNRVPLDVEYRYSRLWQRHDLYSWEHPGTGGLEGLGGFCHWRPQSSDLPDVDMLEQATSSAGMKTLAGAEYNRLPPSSGDPCGTGQGWTNVHPDLLLSATWTGARRWVQTITERYAIVLATEKGLGDTRGQIISRQSASLQIEDARAENWESDEFDSGEHGATDLRDIDRRDEVFAVSLSRAAVAVVGAHRGTTVTWQVPTPMGIGCDLAHTLKLSDQVRAAGKVRRIVDTYDFDAGTAITSLSIALMRGGGESDALLPPDAPEVDVPESEFTQAALASQLGMRNESPLYNDELDGFAGNYDDRDDDINPSLQEFPRRFTVTAPEIPAELRDERKVDVDLVIRIGIPNDLLVL
ncbi:hypothetical protein FEA48_23580 [Pseudomonas nitroreducens]|uniref:Uncharacterized protein n=1 Tax=Pseudomonas nitroreducens TaxID=46680 RepID=A0A5R8ZYU5_PSENT|nr:hypothetical protein [Pseudomonas nitroreducens]TLP70817.1 hypothetical protein FEA48_23580 [Pseudomonas nitroreducens]